MAKACAAMVLAHSILSHSEIAELGKCLKGLW